MSKYLLAAASVLLLAACGEKKAEEVPAVDTAAVVAPAPSLDAVDSTTDTTVARDTAAAETPQ
ncbi:MAG: hypothetical protein KF785_07465 [Gemmatimonadales bacterium]|nr:hypothetical protein [Gemmatimonadales bacterium]